MKGVLRAAIAAAAVASGCAATGVSSDRAEVAVFAAGSLRAALDEAGHAFETAQPGVRMRFTYGASGLLKDRLAAGERADVFASANMDHPQALADAGRATPPRRFARNSLCALAAPGVDATAQSLVDRMLDPAVRLGTSTPGADPSGDYAFEMFRRIERQGRPGAYDTLSRKALQLTGGPGSPPPPAGRNVYAALMLQGQADLFITYCTNAAAAIREAPGLRRVDLPAPIDVAASYGITLLDGRSPMADRFVDFLLAVPGQAILARHGFSPRE